jgi:hypothetical protein
MSRQELAIPTHTKFTAGPTTVTFHCYHCNKQATYRKGHENINSAYGAWRRAHKHQVSY